MSNVLLLGAGTQSLAILPGLHKAGHRLIMISGRHSNYGDKSRYLNKVYRLKDFAEEVMLSEMLRIVENERIDVIIPMGDDTSLFLCKYRKIFPTQNFRTPEYENFIKGYDKNLLMKLCAEKGVPHPETLDLSKVSLSDERVRKFRFPALLKPNLTTGGRGMVKVHDYDELCAKFSELENRFGNYHLQRLIRPGGRQVKVQLYIDSSKRLLASSVLQKLRWYPNGGGASCCVTAIRDDAVVEICRKVLMDIDWVGFADFDIIEDPDTGELLILELNPRLPACIKGSIIAGLDWGNIIVNDALGLPVRRQQYKSGVVLRHLGLDALWLVHSQNKFKANPGWFRLIGKDIYYQDMSDLTDPLPFITGTFQNVLKLMNPEFRAEKTVL